MSEVGNALPPLGTEVEDLPELDIELLRSLVAWAEGDAARYDAGKFSGDWDQSVYAKEVRNGVCKTAYCIAGQTVVQKGHKILWNEEANHFNGFERTIAYSEDVEIDGEEEDIFTVAQRELGLTYEEAEDLFDGDNYIEDVKRVARSIAARRGLTF